MRDREFRQRAKRIHNNVPVGVILLAIGGVYMARQFGVDFPRWFISWEMLLIAIGIVIGFKSQFRDIGWLILIAIGLVFLADDFFRVKNLVLPAILILVGLFIILKPMRPKAIVGKDPDDPDDPNAPTPELIPPRRHIRKGRHTRRNVSIRRFQEDRIVKKFQRGRSGVSIRRRGHQSYTS